MKLRLVFPVFLFSSLVAIPAFSQSLDMEQICGNADATEGAPTAASEEHPSLKLQTIVDEELLFVDHGFCKEYRETLDSGSGPGPAQNGWRIRFYMSHSFTRYFNSDVSFRSSRYNVEIRDYEWAERGSRNFFNPANWFRNGMNPAQMIDEPTNTFTVSIERNGHEFFLSAFHPKFLQNPGQVKPMVGVIDGVPVDAVQPVNAPPRDGQPLPGESHLVRNEFTHAQMAYEVGYGHRFTVLKSRIGNIVYIPQVGVGLMFGRNRSVMTKPGNWYDFEDSRRGIGLYGYGASVLNRVEFNLKNDRFGVFYENRVGGYTMEAPFYDGTQKFRLGFVGNSVGMKFLLFHAKPKKPPVPRF